MAFKVQHKNIMTKWLQKQQHYIINDSVVSSLEVRIFLKTQMSCLRHV